MKTGSWRQSNNGDSVLSFLHVAVSGVRFLAGSKTRGQPTFCLRKRVWRNRLLRPNSQLFVMRLFILLDLEAALQYPANRTATNFFGKDCPVQGFQSINQLNLPYRPTLWGTANYNSTLQSNTPVQHWIQRKHTDVYIGQRHVVNFVKVQEEKRKGFRKNKLTNAVNKPQNNLTQRQVAL